MVHTLDTRLLTVRVKAETGPIVVVIAVVLNRRPWSGRSSSGISNRGSFRPERCLWTPGCRGNSSLLRPWHQIIVYSVIVIHDIENEPVWIVLKVEAITEATINWTFTVRRRGRNGQIGPIRWRRVGSSGGGGRKICPIYGGRRSKRTSVPVRRSKRQARLLLVDRWVLLRHHWRPVTDGIYHLGHSVRVGRHWLNVPAVPLGASRFICVVGGFGTASNSPAIGSFR
uniref:(northern house mosquito) hypothetical protein n=1 Tax=Culex pipiens TaxID=7175 RepID=A0A8D8EZF1_CULPI